MDNPNTTIIIPVGPGHQKVYRLAVMSAMIQGDVEIIVINDSGTDLVALPDKDILILTCDARNPSVGRNMGAKVAKGKTLVFLDSDDLLCPGAIEALYQAYIEGDGQWGIIYGNVIRSDTGELHVSPDQYCGPDVTKTALYVPKRMPTHLIGRQLFLNMGGFNEKIELWEDVELEIRLDVQGVCARHIDYPVYWYNFDGGRRRIDSAEGPKKQIRDMYRPYYDEVKKMACGTCGGNASPSKAAAKPVNNDTYQVLVNRLNSGMTAKLEYVGPDTSVKKFIGPQSGREYRFGKTLAPRTRIVPIGTGEKDVLPEDAAIMVGIRARYHTGPLFEIRYEKQIVPPPVPEELQAVKATPTKAPPSAAPDMATLAQVYAGLPVSKFTPAELIEAVKLVDEHILRGWLAEADGVSKQILEDALGGSYKNADEMSLAELRAAVEKAPQEQIIKWYHQEANREAPRKGAITLLKGYVNV